VEKITKLETICLNAFFFLKNSVENWKEIE